MRVSRNKIKYMWKGEDAVKVESKHWRVHKTGKEERTGRVGGDECQGCLCESSKSEKKGLKDGGETCCDE